MKCIVLTTFFHLDHVSLRSINKNKSKINRLRRTRKRYIRSRTKCSVETEAFSPPSVRLNILVPLKYFLIHSISRSVSVNSLQSQTVYKFLTVILSDFYLFKMADTEAAPVTATPPSQSPAKKEKKLKNPRAKPTHPPTSEMVNNAIKGLKERGGSSLQAIKKYIAANYKVDAEKVSPFIKKYLKSAVVSGALVQTKGKGASGSFKLAGSGTAKQASSEKKKTATSVSRAKKSPVKKAASGEKPKTAKKSAPKAKKTSSSSVEKKSPKKVVEKKTARLSGSTASSASAAVASKAKSPSKAKKSNKAGPTKKPKAPKPKTAKSPAASKAKKASSPKRKK